jgi:uncharacterized protein
MAFLNEPIFLGSLVLFAAGCVQGITGFGLSLLALPLLGMIFGIQETVPILVMLSIVTNAWIAKGHIHELQWKAIAQMLIPALVGVPIGIYILVFVEASLLKTIAGIVIAVFAVFAAVDFSFMQGSRIRKPYLFGFLSGVMNGSVSLSGPPIVAYFAIEKLQKDAFRSNISAYFLILNIITLGGMIIKNVCGWPELTLGAYLLPSLAVGTALGITIVKHINERLFRRLSLGLLLVTGIYSAVA